MIFISTNTHVNRVNNKGKFKQRERNESVDLLMTAFLPFYRNLIYGHEKDDQMHR